MAKGRNYCPRGYREITDLVNGNDVLWPSSQPRGDLHQALNEGSMQSRRVQSAVDVLAERLDELFDRRAIDSNELDNRLDMLDRVEDLEARYVHTGPGLMGDDYTLHLCAKLKKR